MDKDKKYLLSQNSGGSKPSMNPLKFFLNKKRKIASEICTKAFNKKRSKKTKKKFSKIKKII